MKYCKRGHLMAETRRQTKDGRFFCSVCLQEYIVKYRREHQVEKREWERTYKRPEIAKEKCRQQSNARHRKYKQVWLDFFKASNRDFCIRCGYNKCFSTLDFHHRDPKEKEQLIGNILGNKVTEKRVKEVEKTVTLCSNCHRELHAGLWKLEELDNG